MRKISSRFFSPAALFILSQILILSLLSIMNFNPSFRFSGPVLPMLILAFVIGADVLYIRYFLSSMKVMIKARYAEKTEENCRKLSASYQQLGKAQKDLETEMHDIVNTQFTYHSLLEQGKPEEAERFRQNKQKEWSEHL